MPRKKFSRSYSDDEKKETRRKQKRDYATRRRKKERDLMQSLDSDNRRLLRRGTRMRQQINKLKTWTLYAISYLKLCRQIHDFSPKAQADPLGKPRQYAPVMSLPCTKPMTSRHSTSNKSRYVALEPCAGQVSRDADSDTKGSFCIFSSSSNATFGPTTTADSSTNADTADMPTISSTADITIFASDRFTDVNEHSPVRFGAHAGTKSRAWNKHVLTGIFPTCTSGSFSAADTTLESQSREADVISSRGQMVQLLLDQMASTQAFDKDLEFQCDQFSINGELCATC